MNFYSVFCEFITYFLDIYSESCKFQDDIDIYHIDSYIKGTKALFDSSLSHVDLASNVKTTNNNKDIEFDFKEKLTFNIPLKPYVYLTGHVKLSRDENGLIEYSREKWDKSVLDVILSIKI